MVYHWVLCAPPAGGAWAPTTQILVAGKMPVHSATSASTSGVPAAGGFGQTL